MEPTATTPARWELGADVVLFAIFFLALLAVLLVLVYRTMQRPRLYPTLRGPELKPVLTWQAVVRYLVTTPFMVAFWFIAILLVLNWATKDRSPEDMALVAVAVVGAARLLAHIDEEMSRELGKNIPLVVLGIVLIGRDTATVEQFLASIDEFAENADDIDQFWTVLVAFDVLVTATWYAFKFGNWRARTSLPFMARLARVVDPIVRPIRAVINFGKPRVEPAVPAAGAAGVGDGVPGDGVPGDGVGAPGDGGKVADGGP
ncbi:MAG: hypothetical protein Q8P61_02360 [Candidatus Nanopelagicales bacterium]|nr:hypothetical protein [Candidatus Nanopelagicales bacterium]